MIRYSAVEPISGRTYRAFFETQLRHVIRTLTKAIENHQGGSFNQQERQTLFAANYRPSDEQLLRVYACARIEGLYEVYYDIARRWRATYYRWKAKPIAAKPPCCKLEYPIRSATDPEHSITYWQDTVTGEWSMSLGEAKRRQQEWIAKQTALGFGNDRKAREIHAHHTYAVDSKCIGVRIGDATVKHTSPHRLYLIHPKTFVNSRGQSVTEQPGEHPWKLEQAHLLPDGNHLLRIHNCIRGGELEVFPSECRLNKALKQSGGDDEQ